MASGYQNVRSEWDANGNLEFLDKAGNVICRIDGVNRKFTVPSGAGVDLPAEINATEVALADGKVLIGGASGVAAEKTISGDVTTTREGVVTIGNGAVTKAKAKVFASTEQTGTGSSQNVAHGLGAVPQIVLVVPTEHPGTPDTGAFDIAEGAHDSTNVVVTVTANVKFKVLAWA